MDERVGDVEGASAVGAFVVCRGAYGEAGDGGVFGADVVLGWDQRQGDDGDWECREENVDG